VSISRPSWSVGQRSCVDLGATLVCSWDRVSISEQYWIVCWDLGGVDHSKTHLGFHFEESFDLYQFGSIFSALLLVFFGGDMAEVNLSTVKIVNMH